MPRLLALAEITRQSKMAQVQALVLNMFEQGFLYAFLGLGVLITFRFFRFPDLTAEGSYPLGGAVAAALLVQHVDPFVATFAAAGAGAAARVATPPQSHQTR